MQNGLTRAAPCCLLVLHFLPLMQNILTTHKCLWVLQRKVGFQRAEAHSFCHVQFCWALCAGGWGSARTFQLPPVGNGEGAHFLTSYAHQLIWISYCISYFLIQSYQKKWFLKFLHSQISFLKCCTSVQMAWGGRVGNSCSRREAIHWKACDSMVWRWWSKWTDIVKDIRASMTWEWRGRLFSATQNAVQSTPLIELMTTSMGLVPLAGVCPNDLSSPYPQVHCCPGKWQWREGLFAIGKLRDLRQKCREIENLERVQVHPFLSSPSIPLFFSVHF